MQNDALDAAVMPALVALLGGGGEAEAGAPVPPPRGLAVRTKAIFGLGQLLRGNRRAQRLFVTAGGPALLRGELQAAAAAAAAGLGLQAKVLALLTCAAQLPSCRPLGPLIFVEERPPTRTVPSAEPGCYAETW
eukprot:SAG25_NODE_267_length_10655_cov_39.105153_18_plen_134_part_00